MAILRQEVPMSCDRRTLILAAAIGPAALAVAPMRMARAAPSGAPLPAAIADPRFHRRAIEAMVWSMPAVNLELMKEAMLTATPGRPNEMLYWSRLLDWKCQTLTPNSDVIYLKPFWDMRDVGPMVIEIPAAQGGVINGTLMDAWQTPFEDVGSAGLDQGRGGRYLILPPGYQGEVPSGFYSFRSPTFTGYGLLRSIIGGNGAPDVASAVAYARRIRVYPLSSAANPPPTRYTDASGVLFDSVIPYDHRYFVHLDRVIQREPWLERDRAMIDTLATLGIVKGKPYQPDAQTNARLDAAARDAFALLDAQFEQLFDTPFAPGASWAFVASPTYGEQAIANFPDPDIYMVDERGLVFSFVFFAPRRLGEGQFWTMSHKDKAGAPLVGDASYRLRVPPNAPARQFWSITLYDRFTHAFIRNMPATSRSSVTPGLRRNRDGSVDLFFGPTAPQGWAENAIQTEPGRRFEAMARFYGPKPSLFDHSWVLPDIERIG
jgi:hypothetical protein